MQLFPSRAQSLMGIMFGLCDVLGEIIMKMKQNFKCDNGTTVFQNIVNEFGLTVTTIGPLLALSPDDIWNYGNVTVNTATTHDFVLSNNGNSSLSVSSIGITGSGDFIVTSAPATPFQIAAGSSQTITVRFRPTANTGESASLSITSNAANVTNKIISLIGTGIPVVTCSYTLSAATQSLSASAGTGGFTVDTNGGCAWKASSSDTWLTLTAPLGGSGSGTQGVSYTGTANTSSSMRIATITAQGGSQTLSVLVAQDGNAANCALVLSPNTQSAPASGATNSFSVTTSSTCGWGAASNSPWITITNSGVRLGSS